MKQKSVFELIPCEDVDCPERIDCCTTVRWRISEREYDDSKFREWWLLHEGARLYEEDSNYYIQWPMRCRHVSDDGLRCMNYSDRPDICRHYVCKRMAGIAPDKEK
jgi:Fe-S-cluster containining protein